MEAAHSIKKVNTSKFLDYANKAINGYCMDQRISSAASIAKECAEQLEQDFDFEQSILYYEKMAELYLTDEQPTSANQALVKVADLIVLTKNFSHLAKAIKVSVRDLLNLLQNYEKVAQKYLHTPLIKTNAKDLFFKASLCFLANDDIVGAKRAIQNYKIDDANFDDSRENELLNVY